VFFWVFAIAVVLLLFRCSGPSGSDCNDLRSTYGEASQEYQNCLASSGGGGSGGSGFRTGGGSFGGFSTGGGHK